MDTLIDLKVCEQYLKIPRAKFGNKKVEVIKLNVDLLAKPSRHWMAYLFTEGEGKELFEIRPNVNRGLFEKLVLPLRYYFESDLVNLIRKLSKPEKVVAIVTIECNLKNVKDLCFTLYLIPEGQTMKQLLLDYDTALKLDKTMNELSFA